MTQGLYISKQKIQSSFMKVFEFHSKYARDIEIHEMSDYVFAHTTCQLLYFIKKTKLYTAKFMNLSILISETSVCFRPLITRG